MRELGCATTRALWGRLGIDKCIHLAPVHPRAEERDWHPLSLKKLVYLDGKRAVIYRSRMNPSLGRNFEAMDPLEWLAHLCDHIPDPGRHRTLFHSGGG